MILGYAQGMPRGRPESTQGTPKDCPGAAQGPPRHHPKHGEYLARLAQAFAFSYEKTYALAYALQIYIYIYAFYNQLFDHMPWPLPSQCFMLLRCSRKAHGTALLNRSREVLARRHM